MTEPLLVRDVMRIGVPTCKLTDPIVPLAGQMIDQGWTAVVVMDDDGDARGWINERMLALVYTRGEPASALAAADIMDEDVPEARVDIPLGASVEIMADMGVDHLFFMHNAREELAGFRAESAGRSQGVGRAGVHQDARDARRPSDADGPFPAAVWAAEKVGATCRPPRALTSGSAQGIIRSTRAT